MYLIMIIKTVTGAREVANYKGPHQILCPRAPTNLNPALNIGVDWNELEGVSSPVAVLRWG